MKYNVTYQSTLVGGTRTTFLPSFSFRSQVSVVAESDGTDTSKPSISVKIGIVFKLYLSPKYILTAFFVHDKFIYYEEVVSSFSAPSTH